MDPLHRFNDDKHTKEALKQYFIAFFEQQIVERAKKKQGVESLADAIIELENAFDQLTQDYGAQRLENPVQNESR